MIYSEGMGYLLLIIFPFLLADMVNPVLLGGTIYCLGTRHPFINASAALASFFVSYFLAGIVFAISFEALSLHYNLPLILDYVLELAIAVLLIYFVWRQWSKGEVHPEKKLPHERGMGFRNALSLGLKINLLGLPLAIPYLAAIDQILKANLNALASTTVLFIYNVLYILPFALLIGLRWMYRQKSEHIFSKITHWMERLTERYMPWIMLFLALLLVEDAISFFLGYREYSLLSLF